MALLKSDRIDPDMLDERARALLNYGDPRDVTLLIKRYLNCLQAAAAPQHAP